MATEVVVKVEEPEACAPWRGLAFSTRGPAGDGSQQPTGGKWHNDGAEEPGSPQQLDPAKLEQHFIRGLGAFVPCDDHAEALELAATSILWEIYAIYEKAYSEVVVKQWSHGFTLS